MAKPSFSPVLVLGVGEQAEKIMQQIKAWLVSWPQGLQQLVQFLWLEGLGNEPLTEQLLSKVELLKRGGLLQQAAETDQISLRNDGGPLEIKVCLIGPLSRSKGGLGLDKILAELSKVSYAWQPSMGFTGATITTLTWPEGLSPSQELVLQRALRLYRSEEFLDAFCGRILVVDRVAQDGSRVEWEDFNLALARLLYLSIIPGDEPLLMPELGLIRRAERESKLGTLGVRCVSACPPDVLTQVMPELNTWARSWLEGYYSATALKELAEVPTDYWPEFTEQGLRQSLIAAKNQQDPVQTVTALLGSRLDQGLEEKIRGEDPAAAMLYLGTVEKRLTAIHRTLQAKRPSLPSVERVQALEPARLPRLMEEPPVYEPVDYIEEGGSGGIGPALLLVLLLGAGLYRLTANGIIPEGLGWVLGIVLFGMVFLYLRGNTRGGDTWDTEVELRPIITKTVVEIVGDTAIELNPELEVCVELMLQHCRLAKQDLRKLGRALREVAQQFSEHGTSMLNQRLEIPGEARSIAPQTLLPVTWRQLSQSECKDLIMKELFQQTGAGNRLAEIGDELIGHIWQDNLPDPPPLLIISPGVRPLRKIALLAATPKLGRGLAAKSNRRLVNGEAGTLCVVNLYLGLEPADLNLGCQKCSEADSFISNNAEGGLELS